MPCDLYASEDDPDITVAVQLDVTEMVIYGFRAEVTVPTSVAADPDELHDHLAQDEELWLDSLDPTGAMGGSIDVLERDLRSVTLCPAGDGPAPDAPRATIHEWRTARAGVLAEGQQVARLIGDTIRTGLPTAAYLIVQRGEYDQVLYPHSVLDDRHEVLWDLQKHYDDPLPVDVPAGGPLAARWAPADPYSTDQLARLVQELDAAGCPFEFPPEALTDTCDDPDLWGENEPKFCVPLAPPDAP
jgi:hypothetical protein